MSKKASKELTDAIADAVGEAARKGTKKVLESVVEKAQGLVSIVTPDIIQQGLGMKKETGESKTNDKKSKSAKIDANEKKEGKKSGKRKKK